MFFAWTPIEFPDGPDLFSISEKVLMMIKSDENEISFLCQKKIDRFVSHLQDLCFSSIFCRLQETELFCNKRILNNFFSYKWSHSMKIFLNRFGSDSQTSDSIFRSEKMRQNASRTIKKSFVIFKCRKKEARPTMKSRQIFYANFKHLL